MSDYIKHHGIKGQKWGVRRFQNKDGSLTPAGKERYYVESDKQIIKNKDGSNTVPKGYQYNRVGGATMQTNDAGVLYVSSGKKDVDKYIKMFGPMKVSMFTNKAWGGLRDTIQHITVKDDLKMPNENQLSKLTNDFLLENKNVFKNIMAGQYAEKFATGVTFGYEEVNETLLKKLASNPTSNLSKRMAYSVSTLFGKPEHAPEAKAYYEYLRKKGYDDIPDLHDIYNGATETATIIINPNKVECTSTQTITKDVINSGAKYIQNMWDLPISEVFDEY